MCVERTIFPTLGSDFIAVAVSTAFGINVARKSDRFPVGRPPWIGNSSRDVGQLSGSTFGGRRQENVAGALP